MDKFIKIVTLTGADDSTNIDELFEVSAAYPFVEWGILMSESKEGGARFPSRSWIAELAIQANHRTQYPFINLSAHICGKWVRQICKGDWSFMDGKPRLFEPFQRMQLNFHSYLHQMDNLAFLSGGFPKDKQFIFQLDDINNHLLEFAKTHNVDAVGLFDRSGGAGKLPDSWPTTDKYSGYAGGLSPDNLLEQLTAIYDAAEIPVWIDAETHVRTPRQGQVDKFDMDKVRAFLEAAKPFIKN